MSDNHVTLNIIFNIQLAQVRALISRSWTTKGGAQNLLFKLPWGLILCRFVEIFSSESVFEILLEISNYPPLARPAKNNRLRD